MHESFRKKIRWKCQKIILEHARNSTENCHFLTIKFQNFRSIPDMLQNSFFRTHLLSGIVYVAHVEPSGHQFISITFLFCVCVAELVVEN